MRARAAVSILALAGILDIAQAQTTVEYVGGTSTAFPPGSDGRIDLTDAQYLAFYTRKSQIRIAYERINLIEYGQQVDRRLALALLISPILLLSKTRKHFLTIGFAESGQQALVFRVDKKGIRATLAALEARTGLKIAYQDQEARKAASQ
jgi:hypothetical protein